MPPLFITGLFFSLSFPSSEEIIIGHPRIICYLYYLILADSNRLPKVNSAQRSGPSCNTVVENEARHITGCSECGTPTVGACDQ